MLSAKCFEDNQGSNGTAHSDPPISELLGLDNLRVIEHYPRGSLLFVEGQKPYGIHILREGRVKVSLASAEGKTFVLRIARAGDLLGIKAALTNQPYGATAETLERCRIDFISREHLLRLLDRDQRVYASVVQALSGTLSSVVEHTRLLFLSQSASEKLAKLLVKWCNEHGKPGVQGIRINSGLTHEEIGQMICMSRETVTRLFSEFKRRHIVQLVDNAILVRNRKALEAMARC